MSVLGRIGSAGQTLHGSVGLGREWWRVSRRQRVQAPAADRGHVALFAWALPPNSNAGVHRPLSLLVHGARDGWRFTTIQGDSPANQSQHGQELLQRVPPTTRRVVVEQAESAYSWRLFPRVDGGFAWATRAASLAIDALRDDPPALVLASGPPFSMFLAARWVARHFGVPLVLDYRDEWTECPFDFVDSGPDDRRYEAACLADAAAVIFTTESHRRHQLAVFAALRPERTHLLPNGWEPDDFGPAVVATSARRLRDGPLRLAHVGTLSGHNSPRGFIHDLDETLQRHARWRQDLRLSFVGRCSPSEHAALAQSRHADLIELTDHVTKADAVARMREADALLLLVPAGFERYRPGKLFDYVAAGRPVLLYGVDGESSRVLVDELGLGRPCRPGQPGDLAQALEALLARRDEPPDARVGPWLRRHQRDVIAQAAFRLFAGLIQR